VAVKVVSTSGDPKVKDEYAVHMKLLSLCPESITRAFEAWEEPTKEQFIIVMELMAGDFHAFQLSHTPRLAADPNQLLPFWSQIIAGTQCLHKNGYVHRDLKSWNFLVSPDGLTVKMADFGETRTEAQVNTPQGQREYPHQTTLYTAPTALAKSGDFIPPLERTFALRKSWDAYAIGMTMLESWFGGDHCASLAQNSRFAAVEESARAPFAKFYSHTLSSAPNWMGFLGKLHNHYSVPNLPRPMLQLVSDLLRAARAPTDINTAVSPFGTRWILDGATHQWELEASPAAAVTPPPPSSAAPSSSSAPSTAPAPAPVRA